MRSVIMMLAACLLSGCAVDSMGRIAGLVPTNQGREDGKVWCDARYLDLWAYPKATPVGQGDERDISERGYPYVLAATYVLQLWNPSPPYDFQIPSWITHEKSLDENAANGFQASTYLLNLPERSKVVIVAFAGTNQTRDWIHSTLYGNQFTPARGYLRKVAAWAKEQHPDQRIVVTGHSLGGGLAIHVTLHEETAHLVSETWAFNTSPKIGIDKPVIPNSKINIVAVDKEIVGLFRTRPADLGAPEKQRKEGHFKLIGASTWYLHYRWVLTREMLWYADLALFDSSGRTLESTPPLDVIRGSSRHHCHQNHLNEIQEARRRKAA